MASRLPFSMRVRSSCLTYSRHCSVRLRSYQPPRGQRPPFLKVAASLAQGWARGIQGLSSAQTHVYEAFLPHLHCQTGHRQTKTTDCSKRVGPESLSRSASYSAPNALRKALLASRLHSPQNVNPSASPTAYGERKLDHMTTSTSMLAACLLAQVGLVNCPRCRTHGIQGPPACPVCASESLASPAVQVV